MTVTQRLAALRALMKQRGIDAFLVSTSDPHCSEYVGDHFKCRKYLTGFTGSAGTALVTDSFAGLWTDGRYFIQAENELAGSGFTLMKMGQEGVPTIEAYILEHLKEGDTLGFDGRTITARYRDRLRNLLSDKQIRINPSLDLVGELWEDRPALSCEKAWELDTIYAGYPRSKKIAQMRKAMADRMADYLLLSSLEDICWLLNIRGNDVACTPVVLSYLVLSQSRVRLFIQEGAVDAELKESLRKDGVELLPYESIYEFVGHCPAGARYWLDYTSVNLTLRNAVCRDAVLLDRPNPTLLAKAMKNSIEVANMKKAHIKDGVAVTKFIFWLKNAVNASAEGGEKVTELSAARRLEEFRREGKNYLGPSFGSIIAYGPHAALAHYSATPESEAVLAPKGLVLTDTGGNYLEGSTDITRTIILGPVTEEIKKYFTLVLKGHLNLAAAKFLYGCNGQNLDCLARQPLWAVGEDFNHGTGHGVGYLLSVHEGPNGFRWKAVPERNDRCVFEEGMITSDEPGYYREGAFGIRHENLLVCRKAEKNENGQFMEFEPLTLVPFDLDGIDPALMNEEEKARLNAYHQTVYEKIAPHLNDAEKAWLKKATRAI